MGERIKAEGVAFEKILSSPWCRCVDTARLMDLGPVETEATFGNVVVLSDQREELTTGAQALIQAWIEPGNLLVVTHGANIGALTGISPASGDIVVTRLGGDGEIEPVGRIPPPGWSDRPRRGFGQFGSKKTTQSPKFILQSNGEPAVMLEPRELALRSGLIP